MTTPISNEARECARAEISNDFDAKQPLGHHVQLLLTQRDAEIARLRSEADGLRNQLVKEHLPKEYDSWEKVWKHRLEMQAELDQLRRENEELRKDKVRLDWLDSWDAKHSIKLYTRAAIDAAMSKEGK